MTRPSPADATAAADALLADPVAAANRLPGLVAMEAEFKDEVCVKGRGGEGERERGGGGPAADGGPRMCAAPAPFAVPLRCIRASSALC